MDDAPLLPAELQVVRPPPDADAGPAFRRTAAAGLENAARVGFVGRFADDLAVDPANRVGGDDQATVDAWGDGGSLEPGDVMHELPDVADAAAVGLVDVGRHDLEAVARP